MKFKTLSIVFPGGTKISQGEKTVEVRSWRPPADFDGDLLIVENEKFLHQDGETDPEGKPVALVKIARVRTYEASDIPAACASRWEPGYFSWELTDVRPLSLSVQVIAARGIYETELEFRSDASAELSRKPEKVNVDFDKSLIEENLKKTVEQRISAHDAALEVAREFEKAGHELRQRQRSFMGKDVTR